MLEAKDLMTKNVICIKKDIPVIDAIKLMAKNNITGIPVVEDDGVLVGILSEQNVLRLFHTFEDEKGRTVNDFMTQPAIHFEEDEPLLDVCYCLRDNSIRRVPVTSKGKVVGVISRSDILKCILKLLDDENAVPAGGAPNNKKQPVSATTLQSSSLHNTSK
ncbi:unnamed protein product [marine sediment metagenome]|uniref:CBS domain-containing protein n=1 Tax=marine sediment metagenome TaxID=412755 RepID=X1SRS6_9ZZZZ